MISSLYPYMNTVLCPVCFPKCCMRMFYSELAYIPAQQRIPCGFNLSQQWVCLQEKKRSETMPVKCADIQNWIILYFPEYIIIHCSLRLQLTLSIHSFSCPPLLPFHVTTDKSAVLLSCTPTFAPESHNNSDLVWRRLTMWWSAGFCASVGGCILLDLSSLGAVLKDSSWECSKHAVKSANTGCQQKLWHRGKWVNQAQLSASVQMTSRESLFN